MALRDAFFTTALAVLPLSRVVHTIPSLSSEYIYATSIRLVYPVSL